MASVTDRKPELTLLRQPSAKDLVALFERISGRKATNGREAGIDGDCHRLLRRDAAVLTRAQCPPSHRRNRERSALFLLVRSRGCPGDIALNKPTAFRSRSWNQGSRSPLWSRQDDQPELRCAAPLLGTFRPRAPADV